MTLHINVATMATYYYQVCANADKRKGEKRKKKEEEIIQ